jgi:anti-sigma factor RsiW
MRAPRFLRPHAHWREQLDAYADGELGAAETSRFEAHLPGCPDCGARLEQTRALKSMLAEVPQVPAPRSFRLTPGMVAAPVRPAPPRPAPGAFRVARFATAFAIVALVAVVVVDLGRSSTGNSSNSAASAPRESADDRAVPLQGAGAASAATAAGSPVAAAASPAFVPPGTGGVSATGFATPTLVTAAPDKFASPPAVAGDAISDNAAKSVGGASAPGPLAQRSAESHEERDLRTIELALAAVAGVGAIGTLGLYLRRRRA